MQSYQSFDDFYSAYLSEHTDRRNRFLHLVGGWLVLALCASSAVAGPWVLVYAPVVGYVPAWIGHFVFEKNKPATFRNPVWSFLSFWIMFWQMLVGRLAR